jgi:hypothetical protein
LWRECNLAVWTDRRGPTIHVAALGVERLTVALSALEALSPRTPPCPPFVRGGEFERARCVLLPPFTKGGCRGGLSGLPSSARQPTVKRSSGVAGARRPRSPPGGCGTGGSIELTDSTAAFAPFRTSTDKPGKVPSNPKMGVGGWTLLCRCVVLRLISIRSVRSSAPHHPSTWRSGRLAVATAGPDSTRRRGSRLSNPSVCRSGGGVARRVSPPMQYYAGKEDSHKWCIQARSASE